MAPGTRYNNAWKTFEWRKPEKHEDCVENSQAQVLNALNSIVEGLKFTKETFEDFKDKRVPTLDFALEVTEGGD